MMKPVTIRMFDANIGGCASGCCGGGGCANLNMKDLESVCSMLVAKYGAGSFNFELYDIANEDYKDFPEVLEVVGKEGGESLPIIVINNKVAFKNKVPAFDELDMVIKQLLEKKK